MSKTVSRMNFWMLYSIVRYKQGVTEKQAPVNVVLATSEQYLNTAALGRANQMAQVQALNSGLLPDNSQTLGVVIGSINFIGQMSDEEFKATLPDEQAPSEQVTIGDEHGNLHNAAELLAKEAGMQPVDTTHGDVDGSTPGSDGPVGSIAEGSAGGTAEADAPATEAPAANADVPATESTADGNAAG